MPKRKPIIVTDKNDPKLKAYNDSLSLYNKTKNNLKDIGNSSRNTPVYVKKGVKATELQKEDYNFVNHQLLDVSGRYDINMNPNNNFPPPKVKQKIMPIAGIGVNEGNSMGGWYDIYKKPVQPIVYQDPKIITKQQKLKDAGYDVTVDGIWGAKSEAAWKEMNVPKTTNFEQRIQNPTTNIKNSDGTTSTHKMMSFEADGKYYAAPTIVEQNGKLVELSQDAAIDYAFKNKEYKEFKTDTEAQDYANNGYKVGTPLEEKSIPRTPIGNINIEGRNQPYYSEDELSKYTPYKPTKVGTSNDYTISRFESPLYWDKDVIKDKKTGVELFQNGGQMKNSIKKRKYAYGGTMNDGSQLSMVGTGLTSAGTLTGNPYLAGAGLLASGISSVMASRAAAKEAEAIEKKNKEEQIRLDIQNNNNILSNYPTKGIYGSQMYAYGGRLPKQYAQGGLMPTSNETNLVVGDTHNEDTDGDGQTGVQLEGGEVEEGEVVDNDGRVFSKRLGYADRALNIINSPIYKRYEGMKTVNTTVLNNSKSKQVDKNTANRNIQKLANPLDDLFNEQEQFKIANNIQNNQGNEMAMGGYIKKYDNGGTLLNKNYTYNNWNNLDNTNQNNIGISTIDPTLQSSSNPNEVIKPIQNSNHILPLTYSALKTGGQSYYPSMNMSKENQDIMNTGKVLEDTKGSGFNADNILKAGRFIDNAANLNNINKIPNIPTPKYFSTRGLNTNYDITANLNDINSDFSAVTKNNRRGTTSIGMEQANNQGAYVNLLKSKNKLYQDKTNIENQLKNRDTQFRTSIEAQNNALTNKYNMDVVERDWDKIRMKSSNTANLADDFANMSVESQEAMNDKQSLKMYATALNKNGVISANFPEIMKGIEEGNISNFEALLKYIKG